MAAILPDQRGPLRSPPVASLPDTVRDALRPIARRLGLAAPSGQWWRARTPHGTPPSTIEIAGPVWCNICRWRGPAFDGDPHCESAVCPQCGSIARDRFLHWCFTSRTPDRQGARIVETSPRLGRQYRDLMKRWYAHRTSDFDLSMHAGDIQLDLQAIDLPDASLDVVLTAHVLEHVPDTRRALGELHRVVRPGGRVYLQIPLVYGATMVPTTPEFHADNTPVFFNFGWDLTDMLREAGFTTTVLVTDAYRRLLTSGEPGVSNGDGFNVDQLVAAARPGDLTVVADDAQSRLMGFEPPYHFSPWECLRN